MDGDVGGLSDGCAMDRSGGAGGGRNVAADVSPSNGTRTAAQSPTHPPHDPQFIPAMPHTPHVTAKGVDKDTGKEL